MHSTAPAVSLLRGVWGMDNMGWSFEGRAALGILHTIGANGRGGAIQCWVLPF